MTLEPFRRIGVPVLLAALASAGLAFQAASGDLPLQLPRPDGKPGNASKPVKVYILAGQSNMVGMGDLGGARPVFPSVYLSADPAILPGEMPIGGSGLARHGVYQGPDANAPAGATAFVHAGAYDPKTDYAKAAPARTCPVALGTVAEPLPALDGPHTVVVRAFIDVPAAGTYTVHAGFGDSTHSIVALDGKEVYRKEPGGKPSITKVALDTGRRHPVTITYFKGGSAAFWLEQVEIEGKGDLKTLTLKEKKFPYLVDEAGQWSVRADVSYTDPRLFPQRAASLLSATSNNGGSIGPELGFGHVMGTFHDEQVLLIKTSMGNRSLGFDFRPPSSGKTDRPGAEQWEGLEYRLMVEGVHKTLAEIAKVVPGYQGQGYEIAGFGWFQGHKDSGSSKEDYEKHLVHLIQDLRREFKAPKLRAVVATVGFHGYRISEGPWKGVWEAQMAVGDPRQHPEFEGTVASVDTRDFWRDVEESPRNQDYHYHRNPETYLLVGEAMGRAMVRLWGGRAEAIPKTDREARSAARAAAEAAKPVPTAGQKAASQAAAAPMILDGALAAYVASPRNPPALQAAMRGTKPPQAPAYLDDALDGAADYYRACGITDYDWKPFGAAGKEDSWDHFAFDLPPVQADPKAKVLPVAPVAWPAGMETWFAPDFDAGKAGWSRGPAPFGVAKDPIPYPDWYGPSKRGAPATGVEKDVLLLRRTFDLPPLKEGHRYRIRVGGSVHANSGEGFAIYLDGNLLAECRAGVVAWRREGGRPRGAHVGAEDRGAFKDGKITLAVASFPMNNRPPEAFIPARAPLAVWLEEMKLPPLEPGN